MRAAVGRVLVVESMKLTDAGPDVLDASDETRLFASITEACAARFEPEPAEQVVEFFGYHLDLAGRSLRNPAGQEISLTHREFGLLQAFVRQRVRSKLMQSRGMAQ